MAAILSRFQCIKQLKLCMENNLRVWKYSWHISYIYISVSWHHLLTPHREISSCAWHGHINYRPFVKGESKSTAYTETKSCHDANFLLTGTRGCNIRWQEWRQCWQHDTFLFSLTKYSNIQHHWIVFTFLQDTHTHTNSKPTKSKLSQIAKFRGPTWGPPGLFGSHVGPMLAPWTLLSGTEDHNSTT